MIFVFLYLNIGFSVATLTLAVHVTFFDNSKQHIFFLHFRAFFLLCVRLWVPVGTLNPMSTHPSIVMIPPFKFPSPSPSELSLGETFSKKQLNLSITLL
jgi:hypothetical protein